MCESWQPWHVSREIDPHHFQSLCINLKNALHLSDDGRIGHLPRIQHLDFVRIGSAAPIVQVQNCVVTVWTEIADVFVQLASMEGV